MDLNKSNMKKIMLLIILGISFYLGLKNIYRISDFFNAVINLFKPVLLGLAFAFILNVLMRQIEVHLFAPLNRRYTKKWPKFRRPMSILVTLVILLGIIFLILLIVVPELVRTITSLTNNIPTFFNKLQSDIWLLSNKYPQLGEYLNKINIDWANISQMLALYGQKTASSIVNSTVSFTTNIFNTAMTLVLSFVIAINILQQKEKLNKQTKHVMSAYLPQKFAEKLKRLFSLSNRAFSNFIAGQCTEACILGTLCFIGMNIFRFPYAILISVFVAFMALIPIFGAFFSAVLGALLISVVNPIQAFWFIVYFVTLQQLEGNLIFPHVVGSKVGLPAMWVLIAVTVGGNAFGLVGMIVNIPICAVLYTLLREDVHKRLNCKAKQDN